MAVVPQARVPPAPVVVYSFGPASDKIVLEVENAANVLADAAAEIGGERLDEHLARRLSTDGTLPAKSVSAAPAFNPAGWPRKRRD
jgi:hypothetical protein